MADLPGTDDGPRRVTEGYFEREVRLSRAATATFLRDLTDQIEAESRLTVSTDEWEIPFEFEEPIEVEVEYVGEKHEELEIEFESEHSRTTTASTYAKLTAHTRFDPRVVAPETVRYPTATNDPS